MTLAIFGGTPAFPEPLHVGRPNIGDRARLERRFGEVLDRRWLTNLGPFSEELEQRIAERLGVRHCIVTCNATVALELATRALGMRGEVIIPSFTFIATAHALQWQQITPVFCDIDPRTHNLDPTRVEALVTPRTTGIVGVHLWGRACDTAALTEVAKRHNLRLLFDAAHAFGCRHEGRMIGGFGEAEVFSFHATKFVNSAEGGAVTTDDDALGDRIRRMRNFGFVGYDQVVDIGTNGKMSELSAAMGLTSFESMDEFIAVNRRNHSAYSAGLEGIRGVDLVTYPEDDGELSNYQYVVVEVDAARSGLRRDELQAVLHHENVLARRYFHPGCHRMEPYRSLVPEAGRLLPETERLTERVLSLPTGTSIAPEAVHRICEIVRSAVDQGPQVRAVLHLQAK